MDETVQKYLHVLIESVIRGNEPWLQVFRAPKPTRIDDVVLQANPELDIALQSLDDLELVRRGSDGVWETASWIQAFRGLGLVADFPKTQSPHDRVFPWVDEAAILVERVEDIRSQFDKSPKILDLCCGMGSIALAIKRIWPEAEIVGVDKNVRAVRRAIYNQYLNEIQEGLKFLQADVADARAFEEICKKHGPFDIIACNPPYSLRPDDPSDAAAYDDEYATGGRHGDAITERVINLAPELLRDGGCLVLLAYTVGDRGEETPVRLRNMFGKSGFKKRDDIRTTMLADHRIWRFMYQKAFNLNPLPIDYLLVRLGDPTRPECITSLSASEQLDRVDKYTRWIESLKAAGFNSLFYTVTLAYA